MQRLMNNEVFNFDVIMGEQALRVTVTFMRTTERSALRGYTVEMFGKKMSSSAPYIQRIKQVAAERGIRVHIHGKVGKTELF
eukprot:scaffold228480_cov48-Prasinocladus_malaysianus.AAC.1